MTFNKNFVIQKIDEFIGYLKELDELLIFSDQEIFTDSGKLHIAERLLQLIVDTMLDINQHFIKEQNLKIPDDFQSTFYILGENNIFPADFAIKIAPVVGLRNRIVHRYDSINKQLFIETLRKNASDFKIYIKFINKQF
ncbi:MAG: HepT-like ribonuclease domain-containing protein [Patescibacteria group bacterium]